MTTFTEIHTWRESTLKMILIECEVLVHVVCRARYFSDVWGFVWWWTRRKEESQTQTGIFTTSLTFLFSDLFCWIWIKHSFRFILDHISFCIDHFACSVHRLLLTFSSSFVHEFNCWNDIAYEGGLNARYGIYINVLHTNGFVPCFIYILVNGKSKKVMVRS